MSATTPPLYNFMTKKPQAKKSSPNTAPVPKALRAINNQHGSSVGQERYLLYRRARRRVKQAIEAGFYLEAVALLESMISDRIESRTAQLHHQKKEKREFGNLSNLAESLSGKNSKEPKEAKAIYKKVVAWAKFRNKTLHQMVKIAEKNEQGWEDRLAEAKQTAIDGESLLTELSNMVTSLNRKSQQDRNINKD